MSRRPNDDEDDYLLRLFVARAFKEIRVRIAKGQLSIAAYEWTVFGAVTADILEEINDKIAKGEPKAAVYQWAIKELSASLMDMCELALLPEAVLD